jgi:hypothetical protein
MFIERTFILREHCVWRLTIILHLADHVFSLAETNERLPSAALRSMTGTSREAVFGSYRPIDRDAVGSLD